MFRKADPTRRTPVYLQAYTKENLVWQLKLTAVYLGGLWVYESFKLGYDHGRYTEED